MRTWRRMQWAVAVCAALLSVSASATEAPRLLMFEGESHPRGAWRLEVDTADAAAQSHLKAMGNMTICMDAARELASATTPPETECTTKTLSNTRTGAKFVLTCPDGTTILSAVRESKDVIGIEWIETPRSGAARKWTARYRYQGPCAEGSGIIQVDPNSDACKQIRASVAAVDPNDTCASMPADQRKACVAQIRASLADSLKLCQ